MMNHPMSRVLGFLYLLSLVSAGPVVNEASPSVAANATMPNVSDPPPSAEAINGTDFELIRIYEQYAAAAYCGANNNPLSPRPELSCPVMPTNCPDIQGTGRVVPGGKFTNFTKYDTTGYVAVDSVRKLIILAYKGTDPTVIKEVRATLDSFNSQTSTPFCTGCKAATGYYGAFNESRNLVLNLVPAAQRSNPGYQVVVTGHSLGGSIATIAALELRRLGISVHLATYGMPRTTNPALARFVSAQDDKRKNRNLRVTHKNDLIPDLIPAGLQGNTPYRHTTPSYFIASDDVQVPTARNINIVRDDTRFNAAPNLHPFLAHQMYFNIISACDINPVTRALLEAMTADEFLLAMGGITAAETFSDKAWN